MTTATETEISALSKTKAGTTRTVRVALAGATGYAGRELVRLLARHPFVRLAHLASSGRDGSGPFPLERAHPALRGQSPLTCHPLRLEDFAPSRLDLVFLATPHETSLHLAPQLVERGLRVIDLSGAFRLQDPGAYPRWYGFEHDAAQALAGAVYGLTELKADEIRKARLVANPGCYATSIILALAPLLEARWLEVSTGIVCDAKSGASGAGRSPSDTLHFPEVNENLRAYSLFTHRHVPEMLQALELEEKDFLFTPHLAPITRGILSTVYVRLAARRTLDQIVSLFHDFYAQAPLVRVYEDGILPEVQAVAHTNYADLGFALDPAAGATRLVVVSALDNLGKGAAGQAVQNMNLMCGFAEETALG
jgi:N-acetyl-gamma-glutamyl-phosphate reductase